MAAHAKPNHDYHLVNPSPWPFVGSVSAFVMALGAILWFHEILPPWLLIVGAIGVLYTMYAWWSDVIKEGKAERERGRAALGWARVVGWLILLWWVAAWIGYTALWRFEATSIHAPGLVYVLAWAAFASGRGLPGVDDRVALQLRQPGYRAGRDRQPSHSLANAAVHAGRRPPDGVARAVRPSRRARPSSSPELQPAHAVHLDRVRARALP